MKKGLVLTLLCVSTLSIAACGSKDNDKKENIEVSTAVSSEVSSEIEEKSNNLDSIEWKDINDNLKKVSEAENLEVIYENNEIIENENNDIKVTINGYEYVSIDNFSRDLRIPYGDQVEKGGVLIISATYTNNSDNPVYVGAPFSMKVVGFPSGFGRNKNFVEDDLVSSMVEQKSELKANEEVTGYVAIQIKPDAMDKIKEHNQAEIELPGFYNNAETFSIKDAVLEPKYINIAFSEEGEDKLGANAKFYPDKATIDNMGEKKLLVEKEINEEKEFSDVKVTYKGYQVTEFIPNEDQAARFSDFNTGIVLLTTQINVKNDSKEIIKVNSTSATLATSSVKMLSNKFLEENSEKEDLAPGEEGTKYLVFIMDKESYDKLYSEKDFTLDVSIYDEKFARMTQNGDLEFTFKN